MSLLSRPLFVAGSIALASVACSTLAFDDYTSPDAIDGGAESSGDASSIAPDANAGDVVPTEAGPTDPYGDAIRADKPVAWYRFEEDPVANAAKDSAGNRTANLAGGAMGFGAKGISGRGISSDRSGGGFTIGNDLGFAGATPFTLEVWLKPVASAVDHTIFMKRQTVDGGLRGWILYLLPDLSPHFEDWGTSLSARSDAPLPAGYVHLVVTVAFEGTTGTAKMWLNAQPQPDSYSDDGAMTPATAVPLELLTRFEGEADELAIYDKALTPERILAHYLAGKP